MSGAKPGDLVVCIDDKPNRPGIYVAVKKNGVYKVNAITQTPTAKRPAYFLDGVVYPESKQPYPQGQYRFKKLDEPGDKKKWQELIKKHKPAKGLLDA